MATHPVLAPLWVVYLRGSTTGPSLATSVISKQVICCSRAAGRTMNHHDFITFHSHTFQLFDELGEHRNSHVPLLSWLSDV